MGQVLVSDAIGGRLYFATAPSPGNSTITVTHSAAIDGFADNPSFFSDPYAGRDGKDYSGYLVPGIGRGVDFAEFYKDPTGKAQIPSLVWYLPASAGKEGGSKGRKSQEKLLFSDDGTSLRGVTTAVITPIDPATNEGKRQGWLFVTGVIAPHMLATRIDFESSLS